MPVPSLQEEATASRPHSKRKKRNWQHHAATNRERPRHYCGIDVHKRVLVACVVDHDGDTVSEGRFHNTPSGLVALKDWLESWEVEAVAFESTNVYWISLYDLLEPHVPRVILANARIIKHIPGRKTDMRDAHWIAYLLAKNMIPSSYVPPRWLRELRSLTRLRQRLTKQRTTMVNQLHAVLDEHHVDVISVFSSWRSRSCLHVLDHLARGTTSWDHVLETAPLARVRTTLTRHARQLQLYFRRVLPVLVRTRVRVLLYQIQALTESIAEVERAIREEIESHVPESFCRAVRLAETIPGWGWFTAVTVVAEVGDFQRFRSADQLVAWAGLDPSVYQSAGKLYRGSITKRGNKYVRAVLYSCVVPALKAQSKTGRFAKFYRRLRQQRKKPAQVAKVAVMAKMLRALHAMIRDDVPYRDR